MAPRAQIFGSANPTASYNGTDCFQTNQIVTQAQIKNTIGGGYNAVVQSFNAHIAEPLSTRASAAKSAIKTASESYRSQIQVIRKAAAEREAASKEPENQHPENTDAPGPRSGP